MAESMPSVPGMQGAETHKGPHRQHSNANTPFQPYSRRPYLYSTRAPEICPCVCAPGLCTPIPVPTMRPCQSPFQVSQHGNRATMIEVNGKRDWVSWDRLKPAYTTPMNFDVYTRYGRQSRQPSRLGI